MDETSLRLEVERSRAARLRAWTVLGELRAILTEAGQKLPKPSEKSFTEEGRILERGLRKALAERDEALRDLATAARWVDRSAFGKGEGFGLLSASVGIWTESKRRQFRDWFRLIEGLNRAAMRALAVEPDSLEKREVCAALLYRRALQTFQGSVLLAERGMIADALTLVRSCAETALAIVVSRDGDYGLNFDRLRHLNEWLRREFTERVGRKMECQLTTVLRSVL